MTQSDRWKKRPSVVRYFEYANMLKSANPEVNWECLTLNFVMPMPKSWSKTKKAEMWGEPHRQRPDLDNLLKAFKDALLDEDSTVWYYGGIIKTWGYDGSIIANENLTELIKGLG